MEKNILSVQILRNFKQIILFLFLFWAKLVFFFFSFFLFFNCIIIIF